MKYLVYTTPTLVEADDMEKAAREYVRSLFLGYSIRVTAGNKEPHNVAPKIRDLVEMESVPVLKK